jgi:hypothetical protein
LFLLSGILFLGTRVNEALGIIDSLNIVLTTTRLQKPLKKHPVSFDTFANKFILLILEQLIGHSFGHNDNSAPKRVHFWLIHVQFNKT